MLFQVLGIVALIVIALGGYSFYSSQREKALAEKLRKMRESGNSQTAMSDIDASIAQINAESEFFRRNNPRRF